MAMTAADKLELQKQFVSLDDYEKDKTVTNSRLDCIEKNQAKKRLGCSSHRHAVKNHHVDMLRKRGGSYRYSYQTTMGIIRFCSVKVSRCRYVSPLHHRATE